MLAVLFLMALHSTIFSPAKYGIVPEMLPDADLSRANGLLEMSTFVAIVLGTSIGSFLFSRVEKRALEDGSGDDRGGGSGISGQPEDHARSGVGHNGAVPLEPVRRSDARARGTCCASGALTLTVLGISYFWFLGALFQMDLLLFGSEVLKVDDLKVGLMVTALAIGIGAGSMLAGRLSGNKVELGLVPLGAIFMGIFCIALYGASGSYVGSVAMLALLGIASGLFIVPLNAYLQQRGESHEKGPHSSPPTISITPSACCSRPATFWGLHDKLHVAPDKLMLIFGVVTLVSSVYMVSVVPEFLVRFLLWLATHTLFKIRIVGQENVPLRGPGAAGGEPHVARRWVSDLGLRAALHPLHGVEALLRDARAELVFPARQSDSGGHGRPSRCGGVHSGRAARAGSRPRGLHLRRRRDQPDREPAAVPPGSRKDRRRTGRAR